MHSICRICRQTGNLRSCCFPGYGDCICLYKLEITVHLTFICNTTMAGTLEDIEYFPYSIAPSKSMHRLHHVVRCNSQSFPISRCKF